VNVAIVDDGLDYRHEDLALNYRPDLSWDFNFNKANPLPEGPQDTHGTSAAGTHIIHSCSIT
jgi:subtilisin family serine protease